MRRKLFNVCGTEDKKKKKNEKTDKYKYLANGEKNFHLQQHGWTLKVLC